MLNSKIFREEISPDNPNGRLTPPGELVMAVTSYQAQLRIESWFLKLWGKAGFQLWLAVLVATREPVSTVRVESILTLSLPMNYEETEPSIDNWHFSHLSLFSQLAVMLLLQARLDRVSFPLSCPILVSLDHLHVGYHSDTKDILSPLEPPPSEICWNCWIAEEVGETFEGAAIDGFYIFYKHVSPLAGSQALNKFNEGCVEESLLTKVSLNP